jgi:apolipoprotein N-acyltransferase
MNESWRRRGYAVGSGVALALALPGPGLVPLLLLTPGLLRRALAGTRGWAAFRLGWLAGAAQWLAAVPWVVIVLHRYGHLPLPVALLGWVVMSAILGLTWALAGWATARVEERRRLFLLPLALAAVEVLQGYPPWGFPWNPVAAAATAWPWLLAPLPVTGTTGLSLLLLAFGAGLEGLATRGARRRGACLVGAAVLGFALAAAAAPTPASTGEAVKVAAVQPNVPLEYRWDAENLARIEENVWELSTLAAQAGARWVVWPESAVPRLVERDAAHRTRIEAFSRRWGVWLTVGSIGVSDRHGAYFNSIFTASPAGLLPHRFDKVHLVPFGEYVPVVGRVPFLRPLVREVGSFTPGRSTLPVPGPAGPTGYAVCYEVAFPQLVAAEVRAGATVLATITNDGWYGDSAAPEQHLALAVLRAAETRRYVVRAANTGISAIIDPEGRIVQRLGFGRRGLVMAEVRPLAGVTPAARRGAALRWLIVVVWVGAIIIARPRPGGRVQTG